MEITLRDDRCRGFSPSGYAWSEGLHDPGTLENNEEQVLIVDVVPGLEDMGEHGECTNSDNPGYCRDCVAANVARVLEEYDQIYVY